MGIRSNNLAWQIRGIFADGVIAGMSDAQLLRRFAERRDAAAEDAFDALVQRHGPMVYEVCRQLLGDGHAAEDALQACFLVLSNKAATIRDPDRLDGWLYGVAVRAAKEARARDVRRRRAEERREALQGAEPAVDGTRPEHDLVRREEARALHEELMILPEKYRAAVVLCDLEGLTYAEAASRLRCPVATLGVRLSRARERLRVRLTRRGVTPALALLGAGAATSARAAALARATLVAVGSGPAATAGAVSAGTETLARETLRALRAAESLPRTILALLAVTAIGVAAGVSAARSPRAADAPDPVTGVVATAATRVIPVPVTDPTAPTPGWIWVFTPVKVAGTPPGSPRGAHITSELHDPGFGAMVDILPGGTYLISVAYVAIPRIGGWPGDRVVLFTRRKRFVPRLIFSAESPEGPGTRVLLDRYRIDLTEVPSSEPVFFAIERPTAGTPPKHPVAAYGPTAATGRYEPPGRGDGKGDGFEPAPGCSWVIKPVPAERSSNGPAASGIGPGLVFGAFRDDDDALRIYLVCDQGTKPSLFHFYDSRLALYDSRRERLPPGPTSTSFPNIKGNRVRFHSTYATPTRGVHSPHVPAAPDVAFIGVERFSPKGHRDAPPVPLEDPSAFRGEGE